LVPQIYTFFFVPQAFSHLALNLSPTLNYWAIRSSLLSIESTQSNSCTLFGSFEAVPPPEIFGSLSFNEGSSLATQGIPKTLN